MQEGLQDVASTTLIDSDWNTSRANETVFLGPANDTRVSMSATSFVTLSTFKLKYKAVILSVLAKGDSDLSWIIGSNGSAVGARVEFHCSRSFWHHGEKWEDFRNARVDRDPLVQ